MSFVGIMYRYRRSCWACARFVGVAAVAVIMIAASANAQTGTIVGRVVADGQPVMLQVSVQDHEELAALTDHYGRFSIDSVPAGEVVVIARGIGFDPSVAIMILEPGQRIEVVLETIPTAVLLSGVDDRMPDSTISAAGALLLPGLFDEEAVTTLVDKFIRNAGVDTARAWVSWTEVDTIRVLSSGRVVRLGQSCDGCSAGPIATIHGDMLYAVGAPHLRIGLMKRGAQDHLLTFCVAAAMSGESRHHNCAGSSVRVTYSRRPDGSWRRVKVD